ncbi:glycosyltransferase [Microbacterium sp. C5A9]|uniref:glycosyltransferase n=1 Tax=Microbacterium sp. C5A9 TaxID=2736663 RepID=UPI001F5283FD|nr:glycosyltransferase [Microbacterium sp. C5A9]MCI1017615.1 glycosyltransferase [Microbacterium sp. C5A9]
MSDPRTVSVCMATYNGSRYIAEQLSSILAQIGDDDEVVVVDDASSDATVEIIRAVDDPRIVVHRNEKNAGYVRSFQRAVSLATGDVIVLSDQDDIWIEGRLDALLVATEAHAVVASNLRLLDSNEPLRSPLSGRPWLLSSADDGRRWRNELRILAGDAPYFGCAMALRRDALALVMPFPAYLRESHDLWIATAANAAGMLGHLEKATVLRRVHEENASTSRPRGVIAALRSRMLLLRLWWEARRRARLLPRMR